MSASKPQPSRDPRATLEQATQRAYADTAAGLKEDSEYANQSKFDVRSSFEDDSSGHVRVILDGRKIGFLREAELSVRSFGLEISFGGIKAGTIEVRAEIREGRLCLFHDRREVDVRSLRTTIINRLLPQLFPA